MSVLRCAKVTGLRADIVAAMPMCRFDMGTETRSAHEACANGVLSWHSKSITRGESFGSFL